MLKNKRFLASALTAAMVLTMAPSAALAADDPEEKGTSTEETTYETMPKAPVVENGETKGEEWQGNPEQKDENPDRNANQDENTGGDPGETPGETGGGTENPDKETPAENPENPGDSGETGKPEEKPEEPSYVAKNVDTAATYDTLTEALANAEAGNTVELAKNTQENIKIDKSVTIDLGGYTLTGTGEGTVVKISGENLDVTVENGTITGGNSTSYGGGFEIQSGKVTIENCTIEKTRQKVLAVVFILLVLPM